MLKVERQRQLLARLRDRGSADLDDLASTIDVSLSTVRRDLEAMEARGEVERTHGGAVYVEPPQPSSRYGPDRSNAAFADGSLGIALSTRMQKRVEAKRKIGAYAAGLVEPNMTVMLEGGSTVIYAAKQIQARPIQVVTNSLSIAQMFKDDDQVELLQIGGVLYPRSEVTVGPMATRLLEDLHADLFLSSLAGIYQDQAFNINMAMAEVETAMMAKATRTVLLMDSTKFGRQSLVRIGPLTSFDQIVTDDHIDPVWRERVGQRLMVVG